MTIALCAALLGACGGGSTGRAAVAEVEPLGDRPTPTSGPDLPATTTPPSVAPSPEPSPVATPAPTPAATPAVEAPADPSTAPEDAALVRAAVDVYDRTLDALLGDAAALAQAAHPTTRAWRATLTADSPLWRRVYADTLAPAFVTDRTVYRLGPDGRAHHHRIVGVRRESATEIRFDYCNWAPVVEVAVDSGAVVDDRGLFEQGDGIVHLEDGRWRVHELDSMYSDRQPAAEVDPCAPAS